ncbi:UNVERIFIED_CONTAM: hypothetical protein K2H54_057123 [Gekko kuhli]
MSTKAHIHHQGGTRSKSFFLETKKILYWMERNLTSLKVEHRKGQANLEVDWLSRKDLDPGEWTLNWEVFLQITHRFGTPQNSQQDQEGRGGSDSHVPILAKKTVVPGPSTDVSHPTYLQEQTSFTWAPSNIQTQPHYS